MKENTRLQYETVEGTVIKFMPFAWSEYQIKVGQLHDEWAARGEAVDRPTYTVTYADGTMEQYPFDENTILTVPKGTPEEEREKVLDEQAALWKRWKRTEEAFNLATNDLMMEFVYLDSLGLIELPADNAWEVRQNKRGIKIPDNPEAKRRHYINTVLLKSQGDQIGLMLKIVSMSSSNLKEDDLNIVIEKFWASIWSQPAVVGIGNTVK